MASGWSLQAALGVTLNRAALTGGDERDAALQLSSARVGGEVDVRGARLRNDAGLAMRVSQSTLTGALLMTPIDLAAGGVSLRDTTVSGLIDDPTNLRPGVTLRLDGLTYRGIPGDPALRLDASWVLRLLGWAFATLVVAGYTGVVRRG